MEISISKVSYQGCFLTEEAKEKVVKLLEENGIDLLPRVVEDAHVTITYFDDKKIKANGEDPVAVRKQFIIPNEDLGRIVTVKAVAYGEYTENGEVLNQGLEVDMESLKKIVLSNGKTLAELFTGVKPHITVAISDIKDENDKFIAKAVDTYKCDFEGTKSFKFVVELEATLEVCKFGIRGIKVLY